MNLLQETIAILNNNGKDFSDIKWVGCKKFSIPLGDVKELMDIEYDDDYGAPKVAGDLIVVGNNWWLERHEYDGSEWWEYKEMPRYPREVRKVETLVTRATGWDSLEECQGGDLDANYQPQP